MFASRRWDAIVLKQQLSVLHPAPNSTPSPHWEQRRILNEDISAPPNGRAYARQASERPSASFPGQQKAFPPEGGKAFARSPGGGKTAESQ
jgi:hypothetical protein